MARERNLSFSEREGITSLPVAYELEDLSYEVRNEIKYIFDEELNKYFGYYRGNAELPDWQKVFKDWHVQFLKLPVEAFYPDNTRYQLLGLFSSAPYNQVLDVLEFFINHKMLINHVFANEISDLFEREQVAYLLIKRNESQQNFCAESYKRRRNRLLKSFRITRFRFFLRCSKKLGGSGISLN